MNRFRTFLLLCILILSFIPARVVFADTGPKPTMNFDFKQALTDGQVTIVSGILYECQQPDCSDASPLKQLGPQGLRCDAAGCNALAYGFSDYHKLEIKFSDGKTRQSNIFKTAGFDSKYTVTVRADDLLVEARFSVVPSFSLGVAEIIICLCALIGGVLVVGAIIFFIQRSRK